jgi:hydroxypyruvate isomerase
MTDPAVMEGLKFAPNLTWLYTEVPFLDRFEKAGAAGFRAVEFLFPYAYDLKAIRARLKANDLSLVLINTPPGDQEAGDFGLLGVPGRERAFRNSFHEALEAAAVLECPRLHVMMGRRAAGSTRAAQLACALENLAWAAPQAEAAGLTLLVEGLNAEDVPDYLIHSPAEALEVVTRCDHPQVRLQYDVYHAQIEAGNLISTIQRVFGYIGHIQIADVPGRNQPGSGEIYYPEIFRTLSRLKYPGYIGLEYRPSLETDASLEWLPREHRGTVAAVEKTPGRC